MARTTDSEARSDNHIRIDDATINADICVGGLFAEADLNQKWSAEAPDAGRTKVFACSSRCGGRGKPIESQMRGLFSFEDKFGENPGTTTPPEGP